MVTILSPALGGGNRIKVVGLFRVGADPDVVRLAPALRLQMLGGRCLLFVNAGCN
jgi:hypothetical protein